MLTSRTAAPIQAAAVPVGGRVYWLFWWRSHQRPDHVVQARREHDVVHVDLVIGEVVVRKNA